MLPPYTLIRSSRRTLALQISRQGVLLVRAPLRMSVLDIERFIHRKSTWIARHIQNIPTPLTYTSEDILDMKKRLRAYVFVRIPVLIHDKNIPKLGTIKITSAHTRWGSCSSTNNLCFSYRLAHYMQDEYVYGPKSADQKPKGYIQDGYMTQETQDPRVGGDDSIEAI